MSFSLTAEMQISYKTKKRCIEIYDSGLTDARAGVFREKGSDKSCDHRMICIVKQGKLIFIDEDYLNVFLVLQKRSLHDVS
jgi:hypothetical protein